MYHPVLMSEQSTHSCAKIDGAEPVSAGFCYMNSHGIIRIDMDQRSESLNLGPRPEDTGLLNAVIFNSTASAFLDYGVFEKTT